MSHRNNTARKENAKAAKSARERRLINLTTRLRKLRTETVKAMRAAEGLRTPYRVITEYTSANARDMFADALTRVAVARGS